MNRAGRILFALLLLIALADRSVAQDDVPDVPDAPAAEAPGEDPAGPPAGEIPPPIYEDKLLRLAEILGALSFLRDLCGQKDGPAWRQEMSALLDAEQPAPLRKGRLVARFNHGFETFNSVYRACTPSAELAIGRYLAEGQSLASDVRSRYSQ